MRIARFSTGQEPRYGVVELAADHGPNPETISVLNADPLAGPVKLTGERVLLSEARLLAPVIPRSKVVGVGRNFSAHAAERGAEVPSAPILFFKPNTSVVGPGESVIRPVECRNLHYEGELAVVISRICRRVPVERVSEVVFGYTAANDVTARDIQDSDPQWTRGKGFDTFCPLGPWICTHLSLDEAQNLDIATRVNQELRQSGNTSQQLRPIAELVSYISGFTTLLPGDVVLTGTPSGVGEIVPGDEVAVTISEIGTLSNPVRAEEG
ncbi:MAG: fumarylacetoacetate hydrolase family protein [Propionibacteriaceae bacterium]|jgi:2-keto-4-pentenoate hydratase/2-oxohepta-3-ene-1,7-dioic acid hydratase in catechol pathway|nr:fumarylacetoacetate hydrolase family protein [Propionibacteriaceae bacterium]